MHRVIFGTVALFLLFDNRGAHSADPPAKRPATAVDPVESREPPVRDLAALIERVRENEAKYRQLEVFVRKTKTLVTPGNPKRWAITEMLEKVHTVVQDDLVYCHVDKNSTPIAGELITRELVSAYDGEKTRSVEYGNSANIHVGRYEAADVCPPHCWLLFPLRVSFALSTLLGGTDALLRDPKVRRYPRERESFFEFNRAENVLAGEETVDGLRCVKVVCRHWSRTDQKSPPSTLLLWLAVDRNYLCVRSQSLLDVGGREAPFRDAQVVGLRQVAPDLWLPTRVSAKQYNFEALRGGREVPEWEEVWAVQKSVLNPERPVEFFRDVQIPNDVPLFAIENGRLAGKSFRNVPPAKNSAERLKEVVEKVRANEVRYENMAVEIQKEYRHSEQGGVAMASVAGGIPDEGLASFSAPASTRDLRVSIVQDGRTWYSQTHDDLAADGAVIRRAEELEVGDGEWLRKRLTYSGAWPGGRPPPEFATLMLSGAAGAGIHRPHAVFERDYKSPRPLSALLTSKWEDENNKYAMEVQYLGEDDRDGHRCEVVKLSTMIPPTATSPYYIRLVWLAKDRNYLAIRMEGHEPNWSPTLPTGLYTAGDLREISPGVWFPHRHWMIAFKKGSETDLAEGRLAVLHRTDYRVLSVKLNPEVPPATFKEFIVPGGTKVGVVDLIGRPFGQFIQEKDGTPTISRQKYQQFVDERNKTE